ncbi:sensor histidine kinase [Larkinella bovis]|uniref:Sensor histidine kinase n=1 Tax=Larkinella bovis TaxID=683041 RepID=A0ABW0ID77_9BACT
MRRCCSRASFRFRSDSILSSAATLTFCILGIYEAFRISTLLRQSEKEKEQLQIANLQSQLEALKQQVNPHFLFNSLNSLGALIEENPKQAGQFLEELSSVYRYLLRSNEQDLIPLTTELDFIRSYFHLLKTRHGDGLELQLRVDDQYHTHQLPPLTLQLLVENAVKHNIVLPDQPLIIEIITTSDGQVQVTNNLQRKASRVLSNGVGISNILRKYQMLSQPSPTVREVDGHFLVTLPLIRQPS